MIRFYLVCLSVILFNLTITIFTIYLMQNKAMKEKFFLLPRVLQKLLVIFILGPLFIMPLLKQPELGFYPGYSKIIGIVLALIGVVLWALAFLKIGFIPSVREKSSVITNGIYGYVRNPIYTGIIFSFSGLSLFFQATFCIYYLPIVIILFAILGIVEERELVKEYGEEYIDYMKVVKFRLIPFIF